MKKKPPLSEEQRRKLASAKGGKRSLETMTKAARIARAYNAGVQGGRPVVIDHAKVLELREKGFKYKEIAEAMQISMPSVARILRQEGKAQK